MPEFCSGLFGGELFCVVCCRKRDPEDVEFLFDLMLYDKVGNLQRWVMLVKLLLNGRISQINFISSARQEKIVSYFRAKSVQK